MIHQGFPAEKIIHYQQFPHRPSLDNDIIVFDFKCTLRKKKKNLTHASMQGSPERL